MRVSITTILLAVGLALGVTAPAVAQSGACTASFHVLHDDTIGRLSLPAGIYQLATTETTCATASHLFSQFLRDYDGRLPSPWRYSVQGDGRGTFTGRGSFTVTRTGDVNATPTGGSASNGGGSHGDLACPGFFEVEHNDRIGVVRFPAGEYRISLLGGNLTCGSAVRNFRRFLERPAGNLPGGWVLLADAAEFVRGSSHDGFRLETVDEG